MPAKLIVHLPDRPASVHVLHEDRPVRLGRSTSAELLVQHSSVSRLHVELAYADAGAWRVVDLDSKNGLRVEGHRVPEALLRQACWFAIGDVFCEFEPIDATQADALAQRDHQRRNSAVTWTQRVETSRSLEDLLQSILAGIVELADCRRGYVLLGGGLQDLEVRALHAIDPKELDGEAFDGSRSVVARCFAERQPLFLSARTDQAWLRQQASVVAHGLRSIVCLPLVHDGVLLGAVYADSDDHARLFTELDAELLHAFADRASAVLAASDIEAELKAMDRLLDTPPAAP